MASKKYTVQYRRKREGKTNYKRRIKLLSSHKPRLVIRKYSNLIALQIIEFSPKGDKIVCAYDSKKLKELGWEGHTGNIPAAYLSGLYLAKNCDVKEVIVDFGEQHSVKGSALYAVVKGAIDGGVQINCSEKMFPSEDRIQGQHTKTKDLFSKIKPKIVGEQNGKK
jgi:large subunit ribosomal protein L18